MRKTDTSLVEQNIAEHFNTANALFKEGKWQKALDGFEVALAGVPDLAPAHLGKARCLVKLGEWMEAREAFAAVLRLEPDNYSAWLEAGHLCRQMGEMEQALGAYDHAINSNANRHEAWLGATRALEQLGRYDEAKYTLSQAQATASSTSPETLRTMWHLLGRYRLERGELTNALEALRTALALARHDSDESVRLDEAAEILIDIAELLLKDNQKEKSQTLLSEASIARRESTLARLVEVSYRYNMWQEAIEISRRNLELHPKSSIAHWNLAHLLAECWQMSEADEVLAKAEALAPMPNADTMRGQMAGRLGDADTALGYYQDHYAKNPKERAIASSIAMCALYCDTLDAPQVAELTRKLFEPLGKNARTRESFVRQPMVNEDGKTRRIRLGLVSADFHYQHPVNIFMQPILREMDKEKFEIFIYFTGISSDEQTHQLRSRMEHWREATHLNDTQLAKQIDADEIDILMDLSGHTGNNRMDMFAKRAAPVQISHLGYPGSTGLPNMDYIIGDDVVTPPEHDGLYSERVARLPGVVFCYAPEADYPYPGYTKAHTKRPLTFGSFNNVPKLTPHTLRLWACILKKLPDSRLILKAPSFGDPAAQKIFHERFLALGIENDRIIFRGPVGLPDMMAEYADIDIALDPVPYNGGTTTLQAMWMGVPVVVKNGDHFVSRMGASFMGAAGLADWIASDDDEYIAIALKKGKDREALLKLKKELRKKLLKNKAWDIVSHTKSFEELLQTV